MDRLTKLNRRDKIGLACWLLVSLLVGIISLPVMVGREVYQWKHYKLSRFEWEDVVRYGIVILIGCTVHYSILAYNL